MSTTEPVNCVACKKLIEDGCWIKEYGKKYCRKCWFDHRECVNYTGEDE